MAMNPLLFYYYYYLLNNINHLIQYAGTDIKYPIIEMINYIIGNLLLWKQNNYIICYKDY